MLKMHFHLSRTLTHFPPLPTICSHYPRSIRAPPIAPFAQLFNFSPTVIPVPLLFDLCIFLPNQLYHDYSFLERSSSLAKQGNPPLSLSKLWRFVEKRRNRHQLGEFYRVRHFEAGRAEVSKLIKASQSDES